MKNTITIVMLITQFVMYARVEVDTLSLPFKSMLLSECDACGCSATGGGMGYNSLLNTNFIGVRYFYQNYDTKSGIYRNSPWAEDTFNTVLLQGRFTPVKKIEVAVQMSYHNNNRILLNQKQQIQGIGDAVVLGFYTVAETTSDSAKFYHKLNTGLGVKMPLGTFESANAQGNNPAFQLGTGSWDYLFAVEHIFKKNKVGLTSMLNYTLKTENPDRYQYGNQFNYGTSFFYGFGGLGLKFLPQIGVNGEVYDANKSFGYTVKNTAGNILFGKLGMDVGTEKFSVSLNYFAPIQQHLMNDNLQANHRFSVQLNYAL